MNKKQLAAKIRKHPSYIKAGILTAGTVLCFLALYFHDNNREITTDEQGNTVLERKEPGEDSSYEMEVKVGSLEEQIEVPVSARKYAVEEVEEVFKKAGEELEKLILGSNKSLDSVKNDLNLITEIPEKAVSVYWELDNYDAMDAQGHLKKEGISENGTLVKLSAVLVYENEQAVHEFYANLYPPDESPEKRMMSELQAQVKKSDEETKNEKYMILPDMLNGKQIEWRYGRNTRALAVLILGTGVSGILIVSESQRKKEKEKKQFRQMQADYPQIISKFNLYIRAGMTVRRAWFMIAKEYEKSRKEPRKAYEEMCSTMYQIQGGRSEGDAYEEYGERCGASIYRKFGTLLSQNLRKGSKGLSDLLTREAEEAFEDRKNLAKKMGEEAGTKLMIPMFLMLIIVFAIVIIPAFFSIQI